MTYLHAGTCLLIILLACGIASRGAKAGRRLMMAVAGLFLWSWPPSTALFCGTLEWRYPARALPARAAEAIVVLGGSIDPSDSSQPETLPRYDTYARCHYAAWLHRNWKPLPILATGGPGGNGDPSVTIADVMARVLEEAGTPRSMIWRERASRSTYENAVYSARLLRERGIRRIVLVTEAYHMPRSEACFRKQGLEVTPGTFGQRSRRFHAKWVNLFPSASMMATNEETLHEWIGLAWYWVSGKI